MLVQPDRELVRRACARAEHVAELFAASPSSRRAALLDAIASAIEEAAEELIPITEAETKLPTDRLRGELGRTTGQLRFFARLLRTGGAADIRIDDPEPGRTPTPKPGIWQQAVAIGPVAVFGASNFPYAFSTAGGDTASALAAGCPVVLKGHPAHPLTSTRVAECVQSALAAVGLPDEVFSHVAGGVETGVALAEDPGIQAIAFTGSRSGGLALLEIGQRRRPPIPVFAEMSSINPVLLFPAMVAAQPEWIAETYVQSLTNGVGQFCTNPGLLLAVHGDGFAALLEAIGRRVADAPARPMLTPAIAAAYADALARRRAHEHVAVVALGAPRVDERDGQVAVLQTSARAFCADPDLHDEIFGPASLIVTCDAVAEFEAVMRRLEGQLTTSFFADADDHGLVAALLPRAERLAGRLVFNQWPTGVEVCDSMVHGGPWPSTSDGRSTSVGTLAIERFRRPIAYQNFPETLLPERLRRNRGAASSGASTGLAAPQDAAAAIREPA